MVAAADGALWDTGICGARQRCGSVAERVGCINAGPPLGKREFAGKTEITHPTRSAAGVHLAADQGRRASVSCAERNCDGLPGSSGSVCNPDPRTIDLAGFDTATHA